MHIDAIEIFHVALPLRQPLRAQHPMLETVLLRLQSGNVSGWGEASPGNAPLAGEEWAAGVFGCLRDWLAPAVVDAEIGTGEELTQRLDQFRGNRFAKAAIDTAWWDLDARRQNVSLHKLLGGTRDAIEIGPTFDQRDSFEEFLAAIGRAFDAGFARVKLMFRPGWNVPMVAAVRQEFATQTIHVDCEAALGMQNSELLHRLDDFFLAMIEQPLAADDLVGHAMLQESLRTPICLDEGVTTVAQAEMALELHSCKYMNLKPGRVGGLTAAVAIHDLCHHNCVPCWVGAMPQSAIGGRIGFALAAKSNCTYPADFFPADEALASDLAAPLLPSRDADGVQRVHLWSEPGLGVEPDAALLEKFCIARASLGRDSQH